MIVTTILKHKKILRVHSNYTTNRILMCKLISFTKKYPVSEMIYLGKHFINVMISYDIIAENGN